MESTHYKGWAKPGPTPPGGVEAETGETCDAISGRFRIFQLRDGHRFSTDDLLTAWYGTLGCPSAGTILDLGSGIGSAAIIAAWRIPGARVVTVEAQAESVRLARKSIRYNGLDARFDVREGDFRSPGLLRNDEKFDLVLGTPPYFPEDSGIHGDHPQKIACRFEQRGTIADYCLTASRHLSAGGSFASVFPIEPAHQRRRVFDAAPAAGLSIVRWRPMVLRQGDSPLLGVFGMMRSLDLPEGFRARPFEEPPLLIRQSDGSVHPEYSVVKLSIGFPP